MRRLDGKVAVVAGAGSGIGAATAERLAREGCRVVVGDLVADERERRRGADRRCGRRGDRRRSSIRATTPR